MGNIITGPKTQKKIENLEVLVGRPSHGLGTGSYWTVRTMHLHPEVEQVPSLRSRNWKKTDNVLHNFRN